MQLQLQQNIEIYNCDFRLMFDKIKDNSVDLIFTDPPYIKEFINLYDDIGRFAFAKLKEGGSLICYIGHYNLPDYVKLLSKHLTFWWIFCMKLSGPSPLLNHRKVVTKFKPLLWYVKGKECKSNKYIYDFIDSIYEGKKHHKWQQSTIEAKHIISRLTEKNETVVDVCMGSATTALVCLELERKFIGFEIDKHHFDTAYKRISQYKIPKKINDYLVSEEDEYTF